MTSVQPIQPRELLVAKIVARSLPPRARRSLIANLFEEVDGIGQREWANQFADSVEDYKL